MIGRTTIRGLFICRVDRLLMELAVNTSISNGGYGKCGLAIFNDKIRFRGR